MTARRWADERKYESGLDTLDLHHYGSAMNQHAPRSLRIDPELWHAARVRATTDRTTVTAVVTEALKRYVDFADGKVSTDPQERTD